MSEKEKLKPCPMCGSGNVSVNPSVALSRWVFCLDCGANGVSCRTARMAKTAWNNLDCWKEIESLKSSLESERAMARELAEALRKASDMIESEYCSHQSGHGENTKGCYTDFIYQTLANYRAREGKRNHETTTK